MSRSESTSPVLSLPISLVHFYVSRVREEICGRALPGVPIKIMGADPRTIGSQVAKLVRSRFRDIRVETIDSMPRTGLITVQLGRSYLAITLEQPADGRLCNRRSVVFSRFVDSFKRELAQRQLASTSKQNNPRHRI